MRTRAHIDAEVHGFFFAGEKKIEVGRRGVDGSRGKKETEAENESRLRGCGVERSPISQKAVPR